MHGHAAISADVLATYAADAAQAGDGVRVSGGRRRPRVVVEQDLVTIELHVAVAWGLSLPDVAAAVQRRVREYLARTADIHGARVNVVVDEVIRE